MGSRTGFTGRERASGGRQGRRGVSPVIGVVLLLAVTITLGLVVGPAVIGNIGSLASETPNGEFAFLFQEGDEGGTDDFGTSLSAGDGLMIVEMESNRNLDPANVELQSETTGGSLLTDTPDSVYAPGDLMRQGDTLGVAATRGETLRLVWTGTEGDQSAVLSELRVPERGSSVPPGVPEPTLGCDWLDSETASGDLFVTQGSEFEAGDVLACDSVSSTADGTVDIEGELAVVADIDADTVNLRNGGFSTGGDVYGSVTSAGNTDLAALSVTGRVTAGGDLTLDGVTAESGLDSANTATVTDSTVSGNVLTGGDLTLDNTTVTGDIEVGGSLTCEGGRRSRARTARTTGTRSSTSTSPRRRGPVSRATPSASRPSPRTSVSTPGRAISTSSSTAPPAIPCPSRGSTAASQS